MEENKRSTPRKSKNPLDENKVKKGDEQDGPTKQRKSVKDKDSSKGRSKPKSKNKGGDAPDSIVSVTKMASGRKSRKGTKSVKVVPTTPPPSEMDPFSYMAGEDEELPTDNPEPIPVEDTPQQICAELMEEFRKEAWDICLERFFQIDGRDVILFELRDTWLRIMENQWMDEAIVTQEMLPVSIFHAAKDEPPLPLTFDFWSRGTLEEIPYSRRESVMDPFIRGSLKLPSGVDLGGGDGVRLLKSRASISSLHDSRNPNKRFMNVSKRTSKTETSSKSSLEAGDAVHEEDNNTDKCISEYVMPPEVQSTSSVNASDLMTIKSPIRIKSSKDFPYSKLGLKPWTVSQCGGKDGTQNVFRLINQTTSEALRKGWDDDAPVLQANKLLDSTATTADQDKEPDETERFETLSANDEDTETLYEGLMNDDYVGSPENLSNVPSGFNLTDEDNKEVAHLPFKEFRAIDTANLKKGLNLVKESQINLTEGKRPDEPKAEIRKEEMKNTKPVTKKGGRKKKQSILEKAVEGEDSNKEFDLREIQTTPLMASQFSPTIIEPKECKEEDNELMTNRLAIAKQRNQLIQQHRNTVRKRLSTAP